MRFSLPTFRSAAVRTVVAVSLAFGRVAAPASADTITVLSGIAKVSEHAFLDWAESCKAAPSHSRCKKKSSFITNSGAVVPPAGGLAIDFSGVSRNADLRSLRFEPIGSQTVIACPLDRVGTIAVNIGGTGTSTCGTFGTDTVTIYRAIEVKAAPKPLIVDMSRCYLDAAGGRSIYCNKSGGANDNFLYDLRPAKGGYLIIPKVRSGVALDANGSRKGRELYWNKNPNGNNNNHIWDLKKVGKYHMIQSRVRGWALDAAGGRSVYLNANPNSRNTNQLWKITKVGGHYRIESALRQ